VLKVVDTAEGVRCVGLDRAAKRNAIGVDLTLAMEALLLKTQIDSSVRVLLFHGIGGHFSAGMDMQDFFDSSTRPADVLQRARAATDHWRCRLLRQMPQRIVTAVQGYCLGGALPILACSDIVLAASDARFGLPEINFGLVPGAQIVKAAAEVLTPRAVSYAALTGRPISAQQAQAWGLVTQVVEGDPFDQALALAQGMAAGAAGRATASTFQPSFQSSLQTPAKTR
jgi:enoyl-CoA hydratase/carnithine racemase